MQDVWRFLRATELGLVSRSPRRAAILTAAGIPFRVLRSLETEEYSNAPSIPERAMEIARKKCAGAVRREGDPQILVGADTMVVLDSEVLGKPIDEADARAMLASLSGKQHEVVTGLAVWDSARDVWASACETTRVSFRKLTDGEIDDYLATDEPWDKAGAYGVQGRGCLFVDRIEGCYFNVVGLPVVRLGRLIHSCLQSDTV